MREESPPAKPDPSRKSPRQYAASFGWTFGRTISSVHGTTTSAKPAVPIAAARSCRGFDNQAPARQTTSASPTNSAPIPESAPAPTAAAVNAAQRPDDPGRSSSRHASQITTVATNASAVYCFSRTDMSMWAGAVASSPPPRSPANQMTPRSVAATKSNMGAATAKLSASSCAIVALEPKAVSQPRYKTLKPGDVSPEPIVSAIDGKCAPTPTQASSNHSDEIPIAR